MLFVDVVILVSGSSLIGVNVPMGGVATLGVGVDEEEATPRTSESSAADFEDIFFAFRRRAR